MSYEDPGYILQTQAPTAPLSGRNLADFLLCPRKFMGSFFATREQTRRRIGGPTALTQAVRATLVDMYAAADPSQWHTEQLLGCFARHWDGSLCADSLEEEQLHRDGVRMLTAHCKEPFGFAGAVRTDVRFEDQIEGIGFVAVADIVDEAARTVMRVTCARRPPSSGELGGDVSWQLLRLLATRALPGGPVRCVMADMRSARLVDMDTTDQDLSRVQETILDIAARIRREHQFLPMTGKHCSWCRSQSDCPARQIARGARR